MSMQFYRMETATVPYMVRASGPDDGFSAGPYVLEEAEHAAQIVADSFKESGYDVLPTVHGFLAQGDENEVEIDILQVEDWMRAELRSRIRSIA